MQIVYDLGAAQRITRMVREKASGPLLKTISAWVQQCLEAIADRPDEGVADTEGLWHGALVRSFLLERLPIVFRFAVAYKIGPLDASDDPVVMILDAQWDSADSPWQAHDDPPGPSGTGS